MTAHSLGGLDQGAPNRGGGTDRALVSDHMTDDEGSRGAFGEKRSPLVTTNRFDCVPGQ